MLGFSLENIQLEVVLKKCVPYCKTPSSNVFSTLLIHSIWMCRKTWRYCLSVHWHFDKSSLPYFSLYLNVPHSNYRTETALFASFCNFLCLEKENKYEAYNLTFTIFLFMVFKIFCCAFQHTFFSFLVRNVCTQLHCISPSSPFCRLHHHMTMCTIRLRDHCKGNQSAVHVLEVEVQCFDRVMTAFWRAERYNLFCCIRPAILLKV